MNFWSSGDEDGGDGWADEDSLEDLSEQSLGNNEDGQETEDMAPIVAPQESAGSGVAVGGGLFMGRLTRFIEAVTQPEDEEGDDDEGWHDSSQSLGLDDEEEENENGWNDDAQFDELVEDTLQMQVEPATASAVMSEPADDPTKSMLMNSGWEEDLDLSGLLSPVKEEPARQPPPPPPLRPSQIDPPRADFFVPLKGELDTVVVDHTPVDNSRYNRNVSFDASLAVLGGNSNHTLEDVGTAAQSDAAVATTSVDSSGWDEDDGLLDDIEEIDVEAAPPPIVDHTPPTPPPPPPPPQQPQPSTTFSTESAVAPTESSGWDDDGDLDVGDNDAEIADEPAAQMVDHTPPAPPPPPPPAGRMTTEATTSTISSGYQSDNEESKTEKVVDHTPPPLATTNTEAGTAAGVTDRAVAIAEWDDDDDFFDSVEDQEPDVGDQPEKLPGVVEPPVEPKAVDQTPPPPPPSRAESQAKTSGWDDDDDIDVDMEEEPVPTVEGLPTTPTKLLDHIPPPPPPHAPDARSTALGGNSQAAVATKSQVNSSGWDEDDDFDDIDNIDDIVDINVGIDKPKAEDSLTTMATKLVDHTPPPPPPPQSDTHSTALGGNSQAAVATNSQVDSAGWDEDDDIDINDIDSDSDSSEKEKAQKLVDQTPPPPPPPRFGRMTTMDAVANGEEDIDDDDISRADTLSVCNSQRATAAPRPPQSGESLGWKDDDDILDTVVEGLNVVDHTPRPSLSRMRRSETTDAVASNLSVMSSIDGSSKISYRQPGDSENLVDHTPDQPPYRLRRSETNDAVASHLSLESPTEADAINSRQESGEGWDDDSDIMENGIPTQKQTNRKVVDQTPAARASFNRDSSMDTSLLVGAGTSVGESTLESVGEASDRQEPLRLRTMVDHTPATPTTPARFNRGVSLDASLAAMGAPSVGESLDSIHEEGEEIDSDPETAKPGEIGIAFEEETEAKEYSISFQNSMVIPFGASSPPAEMPHAARMVDTFDVDRVLPLVDHTPVPLVNMRSVAASVDVLSQSSEEGDLGDSTGSVDDVQDGLYGNVVDHTPVTPKASKDKVEGSSADLKLEDDTIVGVASKVGLDADIQEDDEMDDDSSHGTSTIAASAFGDLDMRSLVGSVRLAVVEEKHLVDHVPESESKVQARRTDASTLVLADASSDSSHVDDNVVDDDETARSGFGPIVDHTPSVMQRSARSVATSVVTQITGYETDMKLDEDLDNTIGAAASTGDGGDGGDEGWDHDEPDLEEPMGASDEKHLVDHVPKRRSLRIPVGGSTKVVVIPSDDSTHIDTIAEDSPANFGPIVDHTPLGAGPSAFSVAASLLTNANGLEADIKQDEEMDNTLQGGSIDADSGWDHEEPDLDDISTPGDQPVAGQGEEGHVVDHVPERGQSGWKPTDSSIMALVDPLDAVSVIGDELNDENARSSRFGLVVDQTPALRSTQFSVATSMASHVSAIDTVVKQDDDMDGTWFGASTAGGASSDGPSSGEESSAGGDGWGDDDQALDEIASVGDRLATAVETDENHLVDHVPSVASPRPTDASTAVVVDPSVVSSQANEENNDENIDAASFGAVVDHTPSEPQPSVYSVTTSMATHVTAGLENDIKQDEEMDESIWNGGVSTVDAEGWDQNEPELEELADVQDDQLPHVVDHVPERPESRPTDASTFVVADASEMLSEVDDFGQDEQIFGQQIFGPVVDQTPPSQLAVPHSAAGSTIVVPPSVLDDDLDDAVETAGDGDDQNGWDNDMDTIDEAPNPQSGNEQETNREQLVDYVPPEQEEEIPELVRDGSSEMATVGEKSVFPAGDPKEDEFGPVVDHTPILDPLPSPISERVVREESKRNDSSTSDVQRMDSIAAIFSVASKDKDDGLDEDEFGPVVDHLPTVSSRSSLTPSRGGSTVDARATVSEVDADDDDLIGGDGWEEEEIDIDVPQQISSMAASRPSEQSEDRNLSVTWVDTLDEEDAAAFRQKRANASSHSAGNSDFFDAEMGDTSGISLNATRYYDPEVGDESAWNTSLNSDDGDADIPPSTRRLSVDSRDLDNIEKGLSGSPDAAIDTEEVQSIPNTVTSGGVSCKGCSDASTGDCPCVKRLLEANGGKDSMVGKFRTPEGEYIKVDFEKLLQDEITKRRLIEKEFQALRTTIESLKSSKCSTEAAGKSQMDGLNKLHQSNQDLTNELTHAHEECNKLRNENEELRSERSDLKDQLSAWESKQDEWRDDGASFKKEIQDARQSASDAAAAASRDFGSRELELKSEVIKIQQSNEKLSAQVAKFETDYVDLSRKNESLSSELASARVSLTRVEEERSTLHSKEAALNAEIQHLKSSLENETKASSSDAQLKKQISSIQAELASTTGECVELKSRMTSLQQKLQAAEAGNFKYTKEMAKISKQHDQDTAGLKAQLKALQDDLEKAHLAMARSDNDYKTKLAQDTAVVKTLQHEKTSLEKDRQQIAAVHELDIKELEVRVKQKDTELRSTNMNLRTLEQEKVKLASDLSKQVQLAKKSDSLTLESLSLSRDRDVLQEALVESKETIVGLQKQAREHASETDGIASRRELEISALIQERETWIAKVDSSKQEAQSFMSQLGSLAANKTAMQKKLEEMQTKYSAVHAEGERAKLLLIKDEAKKSKMQQELESLRRQVHEASGDRQSKDGRFNELFARCSDLESELQRVQAESRSHLADFEKVKSQLTKEKEHSNSITAGKDLVARERDELIARCRDLETMSSDALSNENQQATDMSLREHDLAALTAERDKLEEDHTTLESALSDQQDRIAALELDLTESEKLLTNKDQLLVIMKEQQRASLSGFQDVQKENKTRKIAVEELEQKIADFDGERIRLNKLVAKQTTNEKSLIDKLASAIGEKETFAQEGAMLDEENEEMLVQLGLLKEQMDDKDAELQRMQEEVENSEFAAQEAYIKWQDAEKRLEELTNASLMNGSNNTSAASEMKESMQQILQEKSSLKSEVFELNLKNEDVTQLLESLQSEKDELVNFVEDLETKVTKLVDSSKTKEKQLVAVIEDMEMQRKDLSQRCHGAEVNLDRVNEKLRESQVIVQEATALRDRVAYLENTISDQQRALDQKDGALQDLQYQLRNVGQAPQASAELSTLRETIRDMEVAADEDRTRIRELESICRTTREEQRSTQENLSAAEFSLYDLEMDLDSKKQVEEAYAEIESRLHTVESELSEKTKNVAKFEKESKALRSQITKLELGLNNARRDSSQAAKESTSQSASELRALRAQIQSLQEHQNVWSSETDAREAHIEREVQALQQAMTTKDSQISSMERQLQSLGGDLSASHKGLAAKQEDVYRLASELEDLRTQANRPVMSQVLELTQDEAESGDKMRSHIVSLAHSLEQSEYRRAEAIERLERERQANADSLRRLTESVKRFYSTLSFGDN